MSKHRFIANDNGQEKIVIPGDKLLAAQTNKQHMTIWANQAVEAECIIHCCIGTKRNNDLCFFSNVNMPVKDKIELLERAIYNLKNNG